MNQPLSVIIAARDAEDTISDQLAALIAQPWPNGGEIIVADNGSTDATPRIVRDTISNLEANEPNPSITLSIVDCPEKAGAGYARNIGAQASRFDHLAFCDADDIVGDTWVRAIGQALDDHPAVGGKLEIETINPDWVVASRGSSLAADALPLFDNTFPVLSSCNLGIRRETFEHVGGFDETYLRGQDAELSLRLYEEGISTHFEPNAVVNYRLRTSLRSIFSQARSWGECNDRLRERLRRRPRLVSTLRSWLWLVVHVHHLADANKRARWVYVAGLRVGLLSAAATRTLHQRRSK